MRAGYRMYGPLWGKILMGVVATLLILNVGPAKAASEPGTVTIILPNEPNNLDPGNTSLSNVGRVTSKNVLEALTEMNAADSSIMPRLATSWKQVDATTWRFVLRKGVKFHDGEDFNAQAVLFNVQRMNEKRIESNTRSRFFSAFKMDVRAVDSATIEFKTDKPVLLLPSLLTTLVMCSPKTILDKWTPNPIGTGPYRLAKWDMGNQIVLERFDGYWGKRPQVQKAIYLWRAESAVRAAMVLTGEADLTGTISRQDANRSDMDFAYFNSETSGLRIPGGPWAPPMSDRRVRLAFNYAVDKDAIRVIYGKDVITATQLVPPTTFGNNPTLKPWPYDPEKAKQLLAEARKDGVPVDTEIALVARIGDFPGSDEAVEAMMTMFRAVGLNVKLKMVETGTWRTYQYKPFPKEQYIFHFQHDNSKGDPAFTVRYMYGCEGLQSSARDKQLDELVEKAEAATGEERKKLWQASFKRIQEEIVSNVLLFHMVGYARIGKRINYKPDILTTNEIQLAQIAFK